MKKNALIATVLGAVALSVSFSTAYAAEVSQTVCQSTTKEYNISPVSDGATYAWGVDNAKVGTYYNITLETAPTNSKATVEWLRATSATTTYDLWSQETSKFGCVGPKSIVHVTVNPLPVVDPASNNICSAEQSAGTPVDVVNLELPVAKNEATVTKWILDKLIIPANVTRVTGTAVAGDELTDKDAIKNDSYTSTNSDKVDVVYTIIPYAGECAGSAVDYTITVYPEVVAPTITF